MCSILKRGLAAQCDHEHPLKLILNRAAPEARTLTRG
jgi:hypothetical protein